MEGDGTVGATELRILGPLEIEIDGRRLRLGPQQRAVLLALLTAGGKVVTSARLAELIWGPEPGDSAASTLRSHIHHLRQALRSAGSAPLTLGTASGGYWLRVAPDLLDAVGPASRDSPRPLDRAFDLCTQDVPAGVVLVTERP